KMGKGILLNPANNDFLTIPTSSSLNISGPITISAWVKVNAFTSNWQAIVTKGDSSYRLHRSNGTNFVAFGTTGLSNTDLTSNVSINDGQWHYIVGVYGGSGNQNKYLYIDGS